MARDTRQLMAIALSALGPGGMVVAQETAPAVGEAPGAEQIPAAVSPGHLDAVSPEQPAATLGSALEEETAAMATRYNTHLKKRGQLPAFGEQQLILNGLKRLQRESQQLRMRLQRVKDPKIAIPELAEARMALNDAIATLEGHAVLPLIERELWQADDTLSALEFQLGVFEAITPAEQTENGELLVNDTVPTEKQVAEDLAGEDAKPKPRSRLFGERRPLFTGKRAME